MTDTAPRTLGTLAACQALLVTNNLSIVSIGSLAGFFLAPDKSLATVPATTYIVGAAASSYALSQIMRARGRRAGFLLGAFAGLIGAVLCTLGIAFHVFTLFCAGTFVAGAYAASGGFYRFAAADSVGPERRSRAISLVLAGGIAGGILGPESSKLTRNLFGIPFLGSYGVLMLLATLSALLLWTLRLPGAHPSERTAASRPLAHIARQPVFLVACLSAITAYAVMNLLMGATPLAMQMCGLPFGNAAFVIETHIVAMYAPAFVTGSLVHRLGPLRVMSAGLGAFALCVLAGVTGQTLLHFWLSSALLGVGWCFLYVGATTLLAESHGASEKAKAQGLNDMSVFIGMGASSAISGVILAHAGWAALNIAAMPLIGLTSVALAWLAWHRRTAVAAAAASR